MSLKKEVPGGHIWALYFNHKSSIFFFFTRHYFTASSHQSGGHSAFVAAEVPDNNLPEKGGIDSKGTDGEKEKERSDLAESQVPVSSEEVWSIHWER